MEIVIFCIAVLCGGFIQSVSGFGFGIFVMMIFPYILPVSQCAAVSALLSMTSSAYLALLLRKKCKYKRLILPLVGYASGAVPAILISDVAPNDQLRAELSQKQRDELLVILASSVVRFHRLSYRQSQCRNNIPINVSSSVDFAMPSYCIRAVR